MSCCQDALHGIERVAHRLNVASQRLLVVGVLLKESCNGQRKVASDG